LLEWPARLLGWLPLWTDFAPIVYCFLLLITFAFAVIYLVSWRWARPQWGVRVLILPGCLFVFAIVACRVLPVFNGVEALMAEAQEHIHAEAPDLPRPDVERLSVELIGTMPAAADPLTAPANKKTEAANELAVAKETESSERLQSYLGSKKVEDRIREEVSLKVKSPGKKNLKKTPKDGLPPNAPEKALAENGKLPSATAPDTGAAAAAVPESEVPVWPVLLAGAAFLYLWWLATLLFDLAVVWWHYIRNDSLVERLAATSGYLEKERPSRAGRRVAT
jgi:hypothetical protein